MPQAIYQIDAFASRRFTGNPAAVCLLEADPDDAWMQQVASEMNLAETSFLKRTPEGYNLRWFTPALEVDLCGHATIAAAHMLFETGEAPQEAQIVFNTRSGTLTARQQSGWIELDFPSEPAIPCAEPAGLYSALGLSADAVLYLGKNRFDYLVQVANADALHGVSPVFTALKNIPCRGTIVTALSESPDSDFVSRFFAPAAGINEDSVTGSAHCCLAPFWQERTGKERLIGYQASPRGGYVKVQMCGSRVILAGQAVTTLRGELV